MDKLIARVHRLKVQNPDGSEWGRNIDTDDIAVDGKHQPHEHFRRRETWGVFVCFVRGVYCCRCTPRTLAISVLLLILIGLAGTFMAFMVQVAETSYAPVLMGFTSSKILASRHKDYALALVISPTIDDPWLLIDVKLMTSST